MIYAVFEMPDESENGLYQFETWDAFHAATFSPEIIPVAVWEPGKGYTRDKGRAQMELINLQQAASIPGISWGELWEIQNRAENVARRAGLLREARENGIC